MKISPLTIEQAPLSLAASDIRTAGLLNRPGTAVVRWDGGNSISVATGSAEHGRAAIRLAYSSEHGPVDRTIAMRRLPAVCERWAFVCQCGRNVLTLYFINGNVVCRHCQPLSYSTRRHSHALSRVRRRLASSGVGVLTNGDLAAVFWKIVKQSEPTARTRPTVEVISPVVEGVP